MTTTENRGVLFLTSSAPRHAGDATAPFILNMAADLKAIGWEVEVLAPHTVGSARAEQIDGIAIFRYQYLWPASWQSLCYGGGAALNLRRNRLNALAVPFLVVAQFLATTTRVARRRPRIVHSHWAIPQGVVGQIVSMLFSIPHVISVHGTDVYGFRGRTMSAVKRWVLARCDHVVANSSATRQEVESLCRPRAISVIPTGATTGVPGDHPKLSRADFADDSERIILFVGRLIPAKGVAYLLEAMPEIIACQNTTLLIVGDGPERKALEELCQKAGLSHHVRFVGAVQPSAVRDYFAIADVFVGPSISIDGESNEAQGNVFVEALLARIPVVASRIGGIPDAVIHERTGLLVDQRSPAQIASAVQRVFSDKPLVASMTAHGLAHALQHFSRKGSACRLSALYRQILGISST